MLLFLLASSQQKRGSIVLESTTGEKKRPNVHNGKYIRLVDSSKDDRI